MGPIKQLKKMFDKGRIVATTTYLVAMCLTLWAALKARIYVTLISIMQTLCAPYK